MEFKDVTEQTKGFVPFSNNTNSILNMELSIDKDFEYSFFSIGVKNIYLSLYEPTQTDKYAYLHVLVDFLPTADGVLDGADLLAKHGENHCMEIIKLVMQYGDHNKELFAPFNEFLSRTPNLTTIIFVPAAYHRQVSAMKAAPVIQNAGGFWFSSLGNRTAEERFIEAKQRTESKSYTPTKPRAIKYVKGETPEYYSPFWENMAIIVNMSVYSICKDIYQLTKTTGLPTIFTELSSLGKQFIAEAVYKNIINIVVDYQPQKEIPTTLSQKLFVGTIANIYLNNPALFLENIDQNDIDIALSRKTELTKQNQAVSDPLELNSADPTNPSDWI